MRMVMRMMMFTMAKVTLPIIIIRFIIRCGWLHIGKDGHDEDGGDDDDDGEGDIHHNHSL